MQPWASSLARLTGKPLAFEEIHEHKYPPTLQELRGDSLRAVMQLASLFVISNQKP
jgi:hypothetical protein